MYLYASVVTKTKKQTNVISLNRRIHTPCLTLFSAIKTRFIFRGVSNAIFNKKKMQITVPSSKYKKKMQMQLGSEETSLFEHFLKFL